MYCGKIKQGKSSICESVPAMHLVESRMHREREGKYCFYKMELLVIQCCCFFVTFQLMLSTKHCEIKQLQTPNVHFSDLETIEGLT